MPEHDHAALQGSFRDPAGSVTVRSDGAYRTVRSDFAKDTLRFLEQPLSAALVAEGKLVDSTILAQTEEELQLRHTRLPFISYPSEWPLTMWVSAATLTLDMCQRLIATGWILKDATPLNIVFLGTSPVFVDVTSIEPLDTGRSTWSAYGQFIRTFLLPMLAHVELGWPLPTTQLRRDGFEPEEVYRSLSRARRLKPAAFRAVTLPVIASRLFRPKSSPSTQPGQGGTLDPGFADSDINRQILRKSLKSLRVSTGRMRSPKSSGVWSEYAAGAGHYAEEDREKKRAFIRDVLETAQSKSVLDVGCNTGDYSRLAAECGARVVSIDSDSAALDKFAAQLGQQTSILPLCLDIAHPTPSTGWDNRESVSFLDRAKGHFDTIFMLAVIHHLLLSSQIPMGHIAHLCADLKARNLVIEWVPPSDPKFVEVLRGRGQIYQHVTEAAFREAFSKHFRFHQQVALANGRTLFHLVGLC